MIEKAHRRIRWLYPKRYVKWLEQNLAYAGIEIRIEKFLALSFLYSLSFSLLLLPLFFLGFGFLVFVLMLGVFFGVQLVIDLIVILIGDKRGSFAESVLPDALQLMAANIRSGLTPDKALLYSARPEFGVLEKEIKLAAAKAVAGEALEDALLSLGKKIKSRIINRTFNLIVEGMRKGGEIASLLEQTAEDIRELKLLKKEIAAQVGMYAIFIFIAVGLASPILFSFSSHLVETMSTIGSKLKIEETSSYTTLGSLRFGIVKVSPEFIRLYCLLTLTFSSIFGSLLIGLLQEGREKAGLKYIPLLLAINLTLYFIARIVLSSLMGFIVPVAAL
ncbi:MAG: type II secretion system F family protein [Candidatus Aenigmatarchaeota archaeon]